MPAKTVIEPQDVEAPVPTCWCYNRDRLRCDLPAGHGGPHSRSVTWTDAEALDPAVPVPVARIRPYRDLPLPSALLPEDGFPGPRTLSSLGTDTDLAADEPLPFEVAPVHRVNTADQVGPCSSCGCPSVIHPCAAHGCRNWVP